MRATYGTSDVSDIEANPIKSVRKEVDGVEVNRGPNVWKYVTICLLLLVSIMAVDISSKGNAIYAKLDIKTISMEEQATPWSHRLGAIAMKPKKTSVKSPKKLQS